MWSAHRWCIKIIDITAKPDGSASEKAPHCQKNPLRILWRKGVVADALFEMTNSLCKPFCIAGAKYVLWAGKNEEPRRTDDGRGKTVRKNKGSIYIIKIQGKKKRKRNE